MKIVITRSNKDDYEESQSMKINDKHRLSVGALCECPEDATIGRGLVCCERVADFMREAYDAGKAGEEFTIDVIDGEA